MRRFSDCTDFCPEDPDEPRCFIWGRSVVPPREHRHAHSCSPAAASPSSQDRNQRELGPAFKPAVDARPGPALKGTVSTSGWTPHVIASNCQGRLKTQTFVRRFQSPRTLSRQYPAIPTTVALRAIGGLPSTCKLSLRATCPECLLASAAERSRTSTAREGHKALNLARLPVPPQPLEGTAILDGRGQSAAARRPLEYVRRGLYCVEHVFWSTRQAHRHLSEGASEQWT